MDRPTRIDRLLSAGCGVFTIEGTDPRDLAVQATRVFNASAGADPTTWVTGMELAGGGSGAAWRCSFVIGDLQGPGPTGEDSVWTGRARCAFALARQYAEINSVVGYVLADIQANYPNAYVFQTRIAGGGRDGIYLVAVLFDEDGELMPIDASFDGTGASGISSPVEVLQITLPQTKSGTGNDQGAYRIDWSIAVEQTTATSCVVALYLDSTTRLEEYDEVNAAGDWDCYAGSYYAAQPIGADQTFGILLSPTGGNIAWRDGQIIAQRIGLASALS